MVLIVIVFVTLHIIEMEEFKILAVLSRFALGIQSIGSILNARI